MEDVRIEDVHFDQSEVSVSSTARGTVVSLDFDPDGRVDLDCQTLMQYSPEQARKLAAALILAAEEAEKQ